MKISLISFILCFAFLACVSPFDYQIKNKDKKLVVEGRIFDVDSCYIKLSYTIPNEVSSRLSPIPDAKVKVIENGTGEIPFNYHIGAKMYLPQNKSFRGVAGNTYQLKVELPDGKVFVSSTDTLMAAKRPQNISDLFNPEESTMEVLVDLGKKGPVSEGSLFNFINYTKPVFCGSCPNNVKYERWDPNDCNSLFKGCTSEPSGTKDSYSSYAFYCQNPEICWNYKRIREPAVFSNQNLAQGTEMLVNVFQVPLSSRGAYFLEIHQSNVSKKAYDYFKLLEDFSSTGSLFDPTPPLLAGNVNNEIDKNDYALGFFLVAGKEVYGYWVHRDTHGDAPLIAKNPEKEYYDVGLLPLLGYAGDYVYGCALVPLAICQPNDIRTNIKPKDWDSFY